MSGKRTLCDIVESCLAIEGRACEIYGRLAGATEDRELARFWQRMEADEQEHMRFWHDLLELARDNAVPMVLDDPEALHGELESLLRRSESLCAESARVRDVTQAFLVCLHMEFYLLHPGFEAMFRFVGMATGEKSPADSYGEHIEYFLNAMARFAQSTSALDLLAETMRQIRAQNARAARLETTDILTGVLDRRGLLRVMQTMGHLVKRNRLCCGLLMIDADRFKLINDNYGHQVGDRVLGTIGRVLRESIRGSDIVGRYGGEEFLVFLPEVEAGHLRDLAENLRVAVAAAATAPPVCTVSIGGVAAVIEGEVMPEIEALIKRADQNLYAAKQQGRNRSVIS